jgi:hypothetical protein
MHSRSTLGVTRNEAVLAAIIAVLAVALIVVAIPKPTIPTLQVSEVSLSPNAINDSAFATLNFTIRNNDATKQHSVRIGFNETNSTLATVYEGNQSLTASFWFSVDFGVTKYQFLWVKIQPSEVSTLSFGVTGTVGLGQSTSTYPIHVEFEDENLTSFANETVSLKVSNPITTFRDIIH